MTHLQKNFSLKINFNEPIKLSEVKEQKNKIPKRGVYFLTDGFLSNENLINEIGSLNKNIFYIGKSGRGESGIIDRLKKHTQSITRENTGASKKFIEAGKEVGFYNIFVVIGVIDDKPGLASFSEEWLIAEYKKTHGHIPKGNSEDPTS